MYTLSTEEEGCKGVGGSSLLHHSLLSLPLPLPCSIFGVINSITYLRNTPIERLLFGFLCAILCVVLPFLLSHLFLFPSSPYFFHVLYISPSSSAHPLHFSLSVTHSLLFFLSFCFRYYYTHLSYTTSSPSFLPPPLFFSSLSLTLKIHNLAFLAPSPVVLLCWFPSFLNSFFDLSISYFFSPL